MFAYSERPGTLAEKKYKDDISEDVKMRRLNEIIDLQSKLSLERNKEEINKIHRILVEGLSKKSDKDYKGRNTQNTTVVFPKKNFKIGDYVNVLIKDCSQGTLFGEAID
jgi:tRNA-2-methylthio-N6-dimethylallyladenosine synthase